MKHTKGTLVISKKEFNEIQALLSKSSAIKSHRSEDTIKSFTVNFPEGHEVDIDLVNSESGPYLNVVLFNEGIEVCCLEPLYELKEDLLEIIDGDLNFIININII